MNKLNIGNELTGETGENIESLTKSGFGDSTEDFNLISSVIGTDIQSVNLKKVMTTVSDVKGGENHDESNENSNDSKPDKSLSENPDSNLHSSVNPDDLNSGSQNNPAGTFQEISKVIEDLSAPSDIKENSVVSDSVHTDEVIFEEEEEIVEKDFTSLTKDELLTELQSVLNNENIKSVENIIEEIKNCFEELIETEKKAALEKFVFDGGKESDFKYVGGKLDNRFEALLNRYRSKKASFLADLGKQKDINLQKKHEVLEILRKLVDAEETTTSISSPNTRKWWTAARSPPTT